MEVVDDPHVLSDATPIPDSPTSERHIGLKEEKTPLPMLDPRPSLMQDDHLIGGTRFLRSIFAETRALSNCLVVQIVSKQLFSPLIKHRPITLRFVI